MTRSGRTRSHMSMTHETTPGQNWTVDNVLETGNNYCRQRLHDRRSQMRTLEITLRPATADDEQFLFDLRRSTMDEHLRRAGESTASTHTGSGFAIDITTPS